MEYSEIVKEIRLELKLTQYELAERVKCKPTTIHRLETGKTKRPSGALKDNIDRLAREVLYQH